MVTGLLTVAERDGNMSVGRGTGLAPNDDGAGWELRELTGGDLLLLEVRSSGELVSGLIGGVAIQESSNSGVDGISHGGIAATVSASSLSLSSGAVGELVALGGA